MKYEGNLNMGCEHRGFKLNGARYGKLPDLNLPILILPTVDPPIGHVWGFLKKVTPGFFKLLPCLSLLHLRIGKVKLS